MLMCDSLCTDFVKEYIVSDGGKFTMSMVGHSCTALFLQKLGIIEHVLSVGDCSLR